MTREDQSLRFMAGRSRWTPWAIGTQCNGIQECITPGERVSIPVEMPWLSIRSLQGCVPLDPELVGGAVLKMVHTLDNTENDLLMPYHCVLGADLRSVVLVQLLTRLADAHCAEFEAVLQQSLSASYVRLLPCYRQVFAEAAAGNLREPQVLAELLQRTWMPSIVSDEDLRLCTVQALDDLEQRVMTTDCAALEALANDQTYGRRQWNQMAAYATRPEDYLAELYDEHKWRVARDMALDRMRDRVRDLVKQRHAALVEALREYRMVASYIVPLDAPYDPEPETLTALYESQRRRYVHFKAFLCYYSPQWQAPPDLFEEMPQFRVPPRHDRDWEYLFRNLCDDPFGFSDSGVFMEALLDGFGAAAPPLPDEGAVAAHLECAMRQRCRMRSVGCTRRCPFCGHLCEHTLCDGHTTCTCREHWIEGLSGTRPLPDGRTLWSCTKELQQASLSVYGAEAEHYTLPEYLQRFCPGWRIPQQPEDTKTRVHQVCGCGCGCG